MAASSTGLLVEMNEVRGDVDGSILVQRQCDELALEFDVISHDIYCAGTASAPVLILGQVQSTRVATDLGIVQRRPAGVSEIYCRVQFHAKASQGLTKARGKADLVCRRTG